MLAKFTYKLDNVGVKGLTKINVVVDGIYCRRNDKFK